MDNKIKIKKFRQNINGYFKRNSEEWVDIDISNMRRIDITIVSDKVNNYKESEEFIKKELEELNRDLENDKKLYIKNINLYTIDEAETFDIEKPLRKKQANPPFSSLIEQEINGYDEKKTSLKKEKGKIISFYSYKGGVGRTVALIQTAYLLAEKNKKVAIIDLDIEAPSFNNIFEKNITNEKGLLNYLYKKVYNISNNNEFFDETNFITKLDIGTLGDVYVVPAGNLDLKYVKQLEGLKEKRIHENGYIVDFIEQIRKRYDLDYILLDSRTGINNWGALSIIDIADEVFLFAYPNKENIVGTNLILNIIESTKKCTVIFSRIDPSEHGIKKAKELFKEININQDYIGITYDTAIALGGNFPIKESTSKYKEISEFILEEEINNKKRKDIKAKEDEVKEFLKLLSSESYLEKEIITNSEYKISDEENIIIIKNSKSNLENLIKNIDEDTIICNLNTKRFIEYLNDNLLKLLNKINSGNDVVEYVREIFDKYFNLLLANIIYDLNNHDKLTIEKIIDNSDKLLQYIDNIRKGKNIYFLIDVEDILKEMKALNYQETICKVSIIILISVSEELNKQKIMTKLVINHRTLERHKNIFSDKSSKILNLSWGNFDKEMLVENLRDVLDKIEKLFKSTPNEIKEITKNSEAFINYFYNIAQEKNIERYVFPKRIRENKYSQKIESWLAEKILENRIDDIGKETILKLISNSAKNQLKDERERSSIISFNCLEEAFNSTFINK